MKIDLIQEIIMENKKNKQLSTYDELMQNAEFKRKHEKSYRKLILSELLLAILARDKISIQSLAKQAGLFQLFWI